MWHSAKIRPKLALGVGGSCSGTSVAHVRDPRGLEVAQEHDVVEVAHRVEVAEADALAVDERPVAHPQRKPVGAAAPAAGSPGRPGGRRRASL